SPGVTRLIKSWRASLRARRGPGVLPSTLSHAPRRRLCRRQRGDADDTACAARSAPWRAPSGGALRGGAQDRVGVVVSGDNVKFPNPHKDEMQWLADARGDDYTIYCTATDFLKGCVWICAMRRLTERRLDSAFHRKTTAAQNVLFVEVFTQQILEVYFVR